MKPFLYDSPILPEGFQFPVDYLGVAASGEILNVEPWRFLLKDMALSLYYYGAMLLKFPEAVLVPFAIIQDETGLYNDGWVVLACFDGEDRGGDPAVMIYDYSRPKSNPRDSLGAPNFAAWLKSAKEDSVRYNAQRAGG